MFSLKKSWDNRGERRVNGRYRGWTRRIQWLEDGFNNLIKLKLEDGDAYREVVTSWGTAGTVWQRFKDGQSIDDAVSILAADVPAHLASKRAKK